MIKCNLAVLLAERGLKMSDVINQTTLAKNTVRSLYYNEAKGIQFETIETLCNYLKVKPGDIIQEINFSYQIVEKYMLDAEGHVKFKILFNYQDRTYNDDVFVFLSTLSINDFNEKPLSSFEIYMDIHYADNVRQNIISQLTALELDRFNNEMIKSFFEIFDIDYENHKIMDIFHNRDKTNSLNLK